VKPHLGSIPESKKRFIFRADASQEIGVGHVLRVFTIAEELVLRGYEVIFVGKYSEIDWMENRIKGMRAINLHLHEEEIKINSSTDILIIDSYTIDPLSPFVSLKKWLKVVAIVDDSTPSYIANLYIHCGPGMIELSRFSNSNSQLVSGTGYLAIRESIRNVKYRSQGNTVAATLNILVIGGGTDPLQFVLQIAELLNGMEKDFIVKLITKESSSFDLLDERFVLISPGLDLEKEMEKTDLVLTLSGTSSWDFISCGFPTGVACGFENQRSNHEYQISNNLALDIGSIGLNGKFDFHIENISELIRNSDLRENLSERALSSVDSKGALRIAELLIGLGNEHLQ
jgi:spore coat polysaccharide biosynthesis predicted glycosyltransferase SpsG